MQHPKKERTLVVIKPDGVQRSLIGEMIKRFERSGLKLVGLKMLTPSDEFSEQHYLLDPNWKKSVGEKAIESYNRNNKAPPSDDPIAMGDRVLSYLKTYLSCGPVVAIVWEGMHATKIVRKIIGGTEPLHSDVGTIRGDFTIDSYEMGDMDSRAVRNLIHASGSVSEAEKEIMHWFKPEELLNYRLVQDEILYDVNLD